MVLTVMVDTAFAIVPVTSEMSLKLVMAGLGSQRSRSSEVIFANYSGWKDFYWVSNLYSFVSELYTPSYEICVVTVICKPVFSSSSFSNAIGSSYGRRSRVL